MTSKRVTAIGDALPPLNDIAFATPKLGWVVGDRGTLLVTRDGGTTWARIDLASTRDFRTVYFNSPKTGWIGGSHGEVLATGTGGL